MNTNKILPGIGFDKIRFGSTRDQISILLGDPDEAVLNNDEDGETETWHYDDLDLSLLFDCEEDCRLTALSITSVDYSLNGKVLIDVRLTQLYHELDQMGYDDIDTEDISVDDESDMLMVSVDEVAVNFWIEDDMVKEIQWAVLLNENQEICWP